MAIPERFDVQSGGAAAIVSLSDLSRLVLSIPGVADGSTAAFASFSIDGKGIAWTYSGRLLHRGPRQTQLDVLVVRCPTEQKEALIEAAPAVYFDDEHHRGYPAVLVRLPLIEESELLALLRMACLTPAPKRSTRSAKARSRNSPRRPLKQTRK